MPSQNKQINVRIDDETRAMVSRVKDAVSASLGLKVSVSDLFRLGLQELERKHSPAAKANSPTRKTP